jgi:hypothetical protein
MELTMNSIISEIENIDTTKEESIHFLSEEINTAMFILNEESLLSSYIISSLSSIDEAIDCLTEFNPYFMENIKQAVLNNLYALSVER